MKKILHKIVGKEEDEMDRLLQNCFTLPRKVKKMIKSKWEGYTSGTLDLVPL